MKSEITENFLSLFRALPADAQKQTRAAYRLFLENPRHPGLQVKGINSKTPNLYSARIGDHYRAIGKLIGDTIYWDWLGTHEEYNKLINRL